MKRKAASGGKKTKITKKRKFGSKVTAYNTLQRVLTKFHDVYYAPVVNVAPNLHNLTTGLAPGVAAYEVVGDVITPLCLTIRMVSYITQYSGWIRCVLFQSLTSQVPAATDILDPGTAAIIAPVRHVAKDDLLFLRDWTFCGGAQVNSGGGGISPYVPQNGQDFNKIYIKGKKMVKISATPGGAFVNGNLWLLTCGDVNSVGSVSFTSRLEYSDTK